MVIDDGFIKKLGLKVKISMGLTDYTEFHIYLKTQLKALKFNF